MVVILAWTVGLLWIESAGYPEQSSQTGFVTYVKNQLLALMILFHVFGLLWLLQFVIACQHMVSSVCTKHTVIFFARNIATFKKFFPVNSDGKNPCFLAPISKLPI